MKITRLQQTGLESVILNIFTNINVEENSNYSDDVNISQQTALVQKQTMLNYSL